MSAGPADAAAPPLTLRTYVEGDATIVHCTGKLTAGLTGILRDEVKRLIPQSKNIVLDLTDLTQMDSMGLGTIRGPVRFGQGLRFHADLDQPEPARPGAVPHHERLVHPGSLRRECYPHAMSLAL